MTDWMQTLLTVAAILAVIYLIVVLVEVVAALALRREYQPVQRSIEHAKQDVRDARKRIDQLAPFIDSGTKEPPFGALYTQARELLRRANETVREAQRQLDASTHSSIPDQPLTRSFLFVPVAREISQRIKLRRGARTAATQLTTFNETFERIGQIQSDIKALPQKEKEALNLVRQRSVDASAAIESETRPRLPLAAERDKLRQVNGFITQMGNLLADSAPPEAAVAAAHGLRLRADEQLQGLDAAMKKVAGERTALLDHLAAAGDALAKYQDKIAQEAQNGMTRTRFTESAAQLQLRLGDIRAMAEAGDYASAKGALDEFQVAFVDEQSRLAQVQQSRENILAVEAKAQHRIATLNQWVNETPARFDLDLTRGMLFQLHGISDQLKALAPSEDLDAMGTAGMLDASIDEIFNRATVTRHDFEQQRNQFEAFAAAVNEESVPAMSAQTRQVAGELKQVNIAYWGDLTPEGMAQAADGLMALWDAEKAGQAVIKESELPAALLRAKPIYERYNAVGAMHADAVKALTAVDADKLQASTGLADDVIDRLLSDADEIGRGSPSWAETPALLLARAGEMRQALQLPAPNYKDIAANAQRLRTDAQAFINAHARQQQQAQTELNAVQGQVAGLRARLAQLNDDARIDFSTWTATLLQRVDAWMSRRDAWQRAPLDDLQVTLQEGKALAGDAEEMLGNAAQLSRRLNERNEVLRTALAELNGVMTSAQTGLSAMSNMGSAHWGAAMMDDARKPMIAAVELVAMQEQPVQRPAPEAAQAMLDKAEQLAQAARMYADAHLSEIASRLGEVTDKRRALAQAIAVAEDAAQGDAQVLDEFRALQMRVQELELRSAHATSFAEALDALTQAVQHAQRFAGRVVGV
jgi:hypothetical protein